MIYENIPENQFIWLNIKGNDPMTETMWGWGEGVRPLFCDISDHLAEEDIDGFFTLTVLGLSIFCVSSSRCRG